MASIHNSTLSIKNLITDYANGRIGIPEFQRDLVWNDSKKVKLIDSIYNGFPIGTIMLWEPEELENIEYRKSRESFGLETHYFAAGRSKRDDRFFL